MSMKDGRGWHWTAQSGAPIRDGALTAASCPAAKKTCHAKHRHTQVDHLMEAAAPHLSSNEGLREHLQQGSEDLR
eukprot:356295-Chlamydomonas_euryale.AAC.11